MFFLVDTLARTTPDVIQPSLPTPKPHDMAYDDLLNQVSQDPMPNLGASLAPSANPGESTVAQTTYGSSYPTQETAGKQLLISMDNFL